MPDIFVSVDIEADGPIPGVYSMLSFGAAAMTLDAGIISGFSRNLETISGATQDPDTMNWWGTQPEAWEACRQDTVDPETAMKDFSDWLKSLPGRPVFVGYPACFDQSFIHWYLIRYTGSDPMGFSGIDLKTYAMAVLKNDSYSKTVKRKMPKNWLSKTKHSHVALEDAVEQGEMFLNMLRENLGR